MTIHSAMDTLAHPEFDVFPGTGKRERILRAAVEVFARTGYFNARVSDVAKAAGVADGTIYLYFEGKEDLLISIFREQSGVFLAGLRRELDQVAGSEAKIRTIVEYHFRTMGSDRALAVVLQVELRQSLKFISLISREELGEYLQVICAVLEEGVRQGEFRPIANPQIVANALFGMLDEMMTTWILSEKAEPPLRYSGTIAHLILRGLT
ncbi:MAG: TetR/AcrR family transcriptional regulator [Thermoanaerobaculia bacterium]